VLDRTTFGERDTLGWLEIAAAAVLAVVAIGAHRRGWAIEPALWTAVAVIAAMGPAGYTAPLAAGVLPLPLSLRAAAAAAGLAAYLTRVIANRRSAELAHRAFTDRLTGLYSYDYFTEALDHELRRAHRYGGQLSLLVLDLDHFKAFNDRHGHATGNELLAKVGRSLRRTVRDSDLAARFGGEELVVLVQGGMADAAALAERIRRGVAELEVAGSDGPASTTLSAGVAGFPEHDSAEGLFAAADAALYEAKRRGRNRVVAARTCRPSRVVA
jgi:diguanylate cyclase (GGDEF)-like protein